ncbi:MAG: calcium/sodium antiporter [Anaerolineae bacterium]
MWLGLGLIAGLILLFLGGDWLVRGASRLAESMGISPLIVGLTVVAVGTSAPELLVSLSAALSGSSDIAVGNIVGSNIANIGLILGLSGLISPINVHVTLVKREIPIMLFVALLSWVLFRDSTLSRIDGVVLLFGLVAFNVFIVIMSRREPSTTTETASAPVSVQRGRELLRLGIGIAGLMLGAQLTVSNATELARAFGVSELVIGVTLVAVGTSLPELVTSVTAALRRESDIAIGNVVGSNIFNVLGILGVTALIQPMDVARQTITVDTLVMIAFSLLLLPFILDRRLGRVESGLFLLAYLAFTIYTVLIVS